MVEMTTVTKPKIDYQMYLQIYNADIDWGPHLKLLKQRKLNSAGSNWDEVLNQVACTVLMPVYDKSVISDPPEKLLFTCPKFSQFDSRNWHEELEKVAAKDEKIQEVRKQALTFGVIYPIHYNPRARQAFSWLVDKALSSNTTEGTDEKVIKEKMEKLVLAYGGAVICNIFNKPEYGRKINTLLNWRTGYFFERLIHEVYKSDEILKIKAHDIEEIKRSNPNLIKKVN